MSATRNPPDPIRALSAHERRIADLERQLADALALKATVLPATYAGAVEVSKSTPWHPPATWTAGSFEVLLGTAGTTTTTVKLNKNGVAVVTLNLTTGLTSAVSPCRVEFSPADLLTVQVTAAGTGAVDLTALVGFR